LLTSLRKKAFQSKMNNKVFIFLLILAIQMTLAIGDAPSGSENSDYEPWKEANQPKVFVDYLRKPLSGEKR